VGPDGLEEQTVLMRVVSEVGVWCGLCQHNHVI
jgi:hypothetical protein